MSLRGLAYKSIDQIPTSTSAPVSGDYLLYYDTSARDWKKMDARSGPIADSVVALTGTTSITQVLHEGKRLYITGTSAATYTLPEPTGSGARYTFIMGEVNSNATIITFTDKVNTNFIGSFMMLDADGSVPVSAVNGDHNISLDGNGATGGALGDMIELIDVATDVWAVSGTIFVVAGQPASTPFNAA